MWILCCGGERSGSTLQYNIVRELYSSYSNFFDLGFSKDGTFDYGSSSSIEDESGIFLVKSHHISKMAKELNKKGYLKIIYSFRDIRDVIYSSHKMFDIKLDDLVESNFIETYINRFNDVHDLNDRYISKYESFNNNITKEISGIAEYLNVSISPVKLDSISDKLSYENMKDFTEDHNNFKSSNSDSRFSNYDNITLLHKSHLKSGRHGNYKKLNNSILFEIENKAYKWLLKNDYNLDTWNDDISFSQLGQDLWVLNMLGSNYKGVFVEIGAADGIELSNTYLLEKRFGWKGLCVEPSRQYEKLKKNRKCFVDNKLIFSSDGAKVIFTEDYLNGEENWYSGIKSSVDSHEIEGVDIEMITTSLESVLLSHQMPKKIDYLSIDTEGSEYDIIKEFPFSDWHINLITIEHNFIEPKRNQINKLLEAYGYIRHNEEVSQWDDWYFHERLFSNPSFLYKRLNESYVRGIDNLSSRFRDTSATSSNDSFVSTKLENFNKLSEELENAKRRIFAIEHSMSWKLTSPFRKIIELLKIK